MANVRSRYTQKRRRNHRPVALLRIQRSMLHYTMQSWFRRSNLVSCHYHPKHVCTKLSWSIVIIRLASNHHPLQLHSSPHQLHLCRTLSSKRAWQPSEVLTNCRMSKNNEWVYACTALTECISKLQIHLASWRTIPTGGYQSTVCQVWEYSLMLNLFLYLISGKFSFAVTQTQSFQLNI